MGVTIPKAAGGAGQGLRQLRAGDRGARPRKLRGGGDCRREQLARGGAARSSSARTRRSRRGCRRLAGGQSLGAFALSEEHAGSDAANQQTAARLDDRGYVIHGRKVWVANAEAADVLIVFAATQPGLRGRGVSAFLVPMDSPGITRVAASDSLGVRGLGCMDLELRDVRVGADCLLGSPGEGFRIAMWALEGGRVAIAAQALGVGEAALEQAVEHAKTHVRVRPADRQLPGDPVDARRHGHRTRRRAYADDEGGRLTMDRGPRAMSPHASMAKLYASEAAHRAADKAMQILASKGIAEVPSSSVCSATFERRRSIKAPRKSSGW